MKTTMKKFMASIAALTLSAAIVAPAAMSVSAAKITIQTSNSVAVKGKTFTYYQIATATEAITGYNYTINSAWEEFFEKYVDETGNTKIATDKAFYEKLSAKLATNCTTASQKKAFGAALAAYAADKGIPGTDVTAEGETLEITVNDGYYLVVDKSTTGVKSAYMVDTIVNNGTMTIKADKPSIDKKIVETTGKTEANNAGVGDTVHYEITAKVPDMSAFEKYEYIIRDTLCDGLTYAGNLKITIGSTVIESFPTTGITVTTPEPEAPKVGGGMLKIDWDDLKAYIGDRSVSEIVVEYDAIVNTDAVMDETGNLNTVDLVYSNDPNHSGEGEFDDEKYTEDTEDEYTKTYVTKFTLHKQDAQGTLLTGAKFKIEGNGITYFLTIGSNGEVRVSTTELDGYTKIEDPNNLAIGEVDGQGNLVFSGLKAGTYTITEVEAPKDYNLLANPFDVTISWIAPDLTDGEMTLDAECSWNYSVEGTDVSKVGDTAVFNVINRRGATFPETGGIGTTIFYTLGGAMVIGAGAMFIVKRKAAEK